MMANLITGLRIIVSAALLFCPVFSPIFYVLYLIAGLSDMADGIIARKTNNEGIEIEVDTVEEERRKGLATAASAALILRCLDEGLYPSWDAQNMISVHLAEKLGYEYDHEYTAYEVSGEEGTHGYEL